MSEQPKTKIPPMALILDLIGSAMFAIGVMAAFVGFELLPEGLRFPYYDLFLMAAGVALMIPMFAALFEQARQAQQGQR